LRPASSMIVSGYVVALGVATGDPARVGVAAAGVPGVAGTTAVVVGLAPDAAFPAGAALAAEALAAVLAAVEGALDARPAAADGCGTFVVAVGAAPPHATRNARNASISTRDQDILTWRTQPNPRREPTAVGGVSWRVSAPSSGFNRPKSHLQHIPRPFRYHTPRSPADRR
jgi:hypothetical protein